ncbi:hypothetical protein [Actinokineospora diospyrosa]|uniref:hypothetical protein n=1 Tax=Actinokineospora diospyrosa TaxID=103728 RepID=UPI0020A4A2E1|nr:hypothetical protein [Actinokineospora diospyrosa]
MDRDTRIQACWALSNAAPRLPRPLVLLGLESCSRERFGDQAVTALRAGISACGRTEPLRDLLADPDTAWEARRECQRWLLLPAGVRAAIG